MPAGQDCVSPPAHSAFSDVDGLIEFVELIAQDTGLPVGIKSAVGESGFWQTLAERMAVTGGGPDFVTVDGGEGGTGAAPLSFADHVALPFKLGFARVYGTFARAGLAEDVVFIGSGRLGFPDSALFAFALGCDWSTSAVRRCSRSAASRPSAATPAAARPAWPPSRAGSCTGSIRSSSRVARPTTSSRCARSSSPSRAPAASQHPALVTPEHIEIVSERYGSAPLVGRVRVRARLAGALGARRDELERLVAEPQPTV